MDFLSDWKVILASQSPRRAQLLRSMDIVFDVKIMEIDEAYPDDLYVEDIPIFLSQIKAHPLKNNLQKNELVITADTIVCLQNQVLGKPSNYTEAKKMLQQLSGQKHQVISGVSLTMLNKQVSFSDITDVYFKKLTDWEIDYYIHNFQPFDKAGAYGIQEWIGNIGIEKIEGSYFNVMGLPTEKLYKHLREIVNR